MDAIRIITTIEQDGEIRLSNLPLKKGQRIEMIVLATPSSAERAPLTADGLLASGLVGIWENRGDLGDSTAYARHLREQAQRRDQD